MIYPITKKCTQCESKGIETWHPQDEVCPVCFPSWANAGMPSGLNVSQMIFDNENEKENNLKNFKK